jgi:hypothetical protein
MGRKKKITFKLNPEWMFKEPIDFEYNKYTLLDYLQKCGKNFDNLKVYPDFVELSLHIANLQSLIKENTLLLTDKKFESCDDEILVKELYPKKPREITSEEEPELEKTLKFSNLKLYDAFNIAKSVWSIAYENVSVTLKKNKSGAIVGSGFTVFYDEKDNKIFVWEYEIKKPKGKLSTYKLYLNKIHEDSHDKETLNDIIETKSKWKDINFVKKLPVFEVKSEQRLPLEETIIPLMKRKILSIIYQNIGTSKIKNFDLKD